MKNRISFNMLIASLMAISILVSCHSQIKTNIVFEEFINSSNKYTVYVGKQKTNADNDVQCDKYFSYKDLNDGYIVRGADLRHLISFLQDVNIRNILISDKIDENFYTLEFTGNDKLGSKKNILDKFLDYYDLFIYKEKVLEKGYIIKLENDKNHAFLAEPNSESLLEQNGNIVSLRNLSLKTLSNVIEDIYGVRFNYNSPGNLKQYNINFDSSISIDSLEKFLNKKYGIQFENEQVNVLKYHVRMKK